MKQNKLNPKSEAKVKKGFAAFFISMLPALGIYMFTNMMFADINATNPEESVIMWTFVVSWVAFGYWFYYKTDSIKRMGYRTLIILAIMSFIFPLTILIAGGKASINETNPFAMAGGIIGTGIAFIFFAVVGILFGLAFSISAFFLGRSLNNETKNNQ